MVEEAGPGGTIQVQDAESRYATLLKFDLVGSTEIWNSLNRSDQLELLRGFRAVADETLKPYDVKVEWAGDGALVAFGYPEVRLDAAEAAVRTGLALVQAVRSVRVVRGVQLELRVGIASGPLTIDLQSGAFGGLSINRADRLMALAGPGHVVVAEDTRRLVKNYFAYEDLGVVRLKGFGDTNRVWRVVGETSVVSRFAAQRLEEAPHEIIGRADTLARLTDAWLAARRGSGSAICLVGDAGMGKSRLARAVLERAKRDGATVLEIDCRPSTENSPLLPIGVLLRRTARIGPSASEAEKEMAAVTLLARVLGETAARDAFPYLAPLFGLKSTPIPIDKTREQVRATTINTIVTIVRGLAAQSPLALLCEDLHWADDTTAHVVQSIAQWIGKSGAMMVLTRWPKPVTQIDLERVTEACDTIPIDPLPSSNATELVQVMAGNALSPERVAAIVGRCGGVPLLLEEVTRSMLESIDADTTVPATHSDSPVPPELQLVVESRLSRWPDWKGIVQAASVIGREFPVSVLKAMVPEKSGEINAALTLFAEHGLFVPQTLADRVSFRHALIRDAVYETLVSKRYLRGLHSRAADALAAGYLGTPDASPDVLAHHLRLAERLNEALNTRLAAGEDSFKRGAYVEARGQCDAAQDLIDQVHDRATVGSEEFKLCVLRGMVGAGTHGYSAEPVAMAYQQAQEMFDQRTTSDQRYPVVRGLATAHLVRGEIASAFRYSQEGLKLAEQSGRPDYRIDAMSVLSYTTLYFDRLADCRYWIDCCLELYEAEGGDSFRYPVPQDAKTACLALLPTAAWLLGDAAGAEEAIVRGLQHADSLGREFDKALVHAWIAGVRYTQRRYIEGLQHAGTAHALGKEHKFEEWEGVGAMMALLCQSALQPSPDAVTQAIAVAEQFKSKGVGLNAPYFLWGIARGLVTAGNVRDAIATLDLALHTAAVSQETRMNPEIWTLKAQFESDHATATSLLMDAFRLAEAQGAVANALRAASSLIVRADADTEAVERARMCLQLLDGGIPWDRARPLWMREELTVVRQQVRSLQSARGI